MDKKTEAENLKKLLWYHNNLYYNLDKPEISDYEYDLLYTRLKNLEKQLNGKSVLTFYSTFKTI